jgi:hypothetical protein
MPAVPFGILARLSGYEAIFWGTGRDDREPIHDMFFSRNAGFST